MGVHLKNFHPDVEPRYIKVGTIQSQHPPNPPIDQFVRPYKCSYKDCQYRTVDAEAFRTHVVSNHGQFAVLSCDFCHKHLHVQPLIYHMREHQMNEYQCPYCLHGDAEKERLLNHLLNCHPGRPGKVLLRKQITTSSAGGPNVNITDISGPPPPSSSLPQDPSNKGDKKHTSKPDGKPSESSPDGAGSASPTPAPVKERPQSPWNVEGRRMSRSLSRELDSKAENAAKQGEGDGLSKSSGSSIEEGLTSPSTEKTGLSSHALYRCVIPIPTKQPINPVPCLERKELMFDKMMNLAGSSFEAKKKKEDIDMRTKNPIPTEEYEKLPKYVPDERLHSCGIDGCNYLSCDDMMLKYHIRTLHADITSFPCPHCTDITITVEKISSHFKLHGDRLYRCGWCSYISYRRNVVERHMKEKHPTKKAFDFVIREPDESDGQKKQEEKIEEPATPVIPQVPQDPQWLCDLCKFCSVTQQEMVNHTSLKHAIKSQYKCGYCNVRSSVRASFDAHFAAKHLYQPFRVLCMYYRIDSEDIEPISQGNGQHSHEPLWKRNDPERIRHIRGILIDDDPETRKTLLKQTGTGKPDKGEFVCPMCRSFKTSCVATFRSHLCREADYLRYECAECGVSNALLPSLQRHFTKMHHKPFTQESYVNLPVEDDKENWVEGVISHQEQLIKCWLEKGGPEPSEQTGAMAVHQPPPAKASTSRRSSASSVSSAPSSEGSSQQGVVLHDSGSERGRFVCDTCGSECRSAAGLKSHTTAMHQARFKCHYCPFASNTEDAVKQHCTVKHPKLQSEVIDVSQRLRPQKVEDTDPAEVDNAIKEDSSGSILPTKEEEKGDISDEKISKEKITSKESESLEISTDKVDKLTEEKAKTEGGDTPEVTKTHKCPFCPFVSNTTSGLGHHKRTKHADRRLFMCLHCNARFNNSFDVVRHNKWKHSHLKPQFTHLQEDHASSETPKTDGDTTTSADSSDSSLTTVIKDPTASASGASSPQWPPGPKSKKGKARKSFPNASLLKVSAGKPAAEAKVDSIQPVSIVSNSEPQVTYSCCHCNQQSNKIAMEEHMKKQHRDLPHQVRREEGDKVFTEVHVYKCIHCVVESISLAQAMDHWIQNHALLDFKFQMVMRHCGEVSNQVVTSTTEDPPQTPLVDEVKDSVTPEADTSSSSAAGSSAIISSSSEEQSNKTVKPLKIAKRRTSGKETKSPAQCDSEDEQSEASEIVDEPLVQTSSELDEEGFVFKCGLCKKSSAKLEELEAHFSKIHADRELTYKKMRKEAFEQIYRAEYECGHCGERGRHIVLKRHHKTTHLNLPFKVVRVNQNIYYRCDVCCHVVKNLQSMRYHIRRHHPEADEFTFSKLTLGSPVRPPMKQPFKCNYCGDVGETLQEMRTHHAFLHSHLDCSITNLMDEALSSVHSPTPSHSSNEVKNPPLVPLPVISKCSSPQVADISSPAADIKSPVIPEMKNTARKSITTLKKRHVAMKSTSKSQPRASTSSCSDEDGQSWYGVPQPSIQMENLYAFVNLGAGVPMRLTVQRLGKLLDLQPKVMVYDDQLQ
ncbi:RE1-silencing transcription factor [Penaeus vannamei]|uniref:RE1-silencing transcription factor n=1 Tax=Penaeus vannamei TaxID=6689 RepID=A0A423TCM2_PENVA|nr:RE1-silencing transcription factor [Penaeus vannamei]